MGSKRRGYILRLALLFLFFTIFLITDILLLESLFSTTLDAFDTIGLVSKRDYTLKTAVLFFREDLVYGYKLMQSKIMFFDYI